MCPYLLPIKVEMTRALLASSPRRNVASVLKSAEGFVLRHTKRYLIIGTPIFHRYHPNNKISPDNDFVNELSKLVKTELLDSPPKLVPELLYSPHTPAFTDFRIASVKGYFPRHF